ncbi:MAG: PolC-type DNA polymerase III [Oscillospiraceae bacterium]|jgi:DNA polymerase-3 subunit alpha (Gram-positive type)|nr:PolC-type DNA polymerase III [Oscillospiraceae bacterium]
MKDLPKLKDMFPYTADCGGASDADIVSAIANKGKRTLLITLQTSVPIAPVMLSMCEAKIKDAMKLKQVTIAAIAPPVKKSVKKQAGEILLGDKPIKGSSIKMSELTPESGNVTVEGEVFWSEVRAWRNGSGVTHNFNITDFTSSARIKASGEINIAVGDCLRVKGRYDYDNYYKENLIVPFSIERIERTIREDTHDGDKRVELHLHTKMSALDALTDPEKAVETAARWGHKAIAITNHAVVHDYPEFSKACERYGVKPIYGVEAYYVNDMDDRLAYKPAPNTDPGTQCPLDEYIAFDLESTGLDTNGDRITEIGAVLMRGGKPQERFSTFVNPGRPIPPEITRLTGINDLDVAVAPFEGEAVSDFLKFSRGLPLVAHNADFDTGLILAACERSGITMTNATIDTYQMALDLLPNAGRGNYNLAALARILQLPDFKHHRAVDDAETLSLIMEDFRKMLADQGISDATQIDGHFRAARTAFALKDRYPKHIILLVKEKAGLKNLYKLISQSHLNPFTKGYPVMTKSMILNHREGLIVGSACENSEIFRAITGNASNRELIRLSEFYDYFEIQPIANNMFMLNNDRYSGIEQLRGFNRRMTALGEMTGKPVVATGDVHFLNPEDEIGRTILTANKFKNADDYLPLYFKTTTEMLEEFSYLGEDTARTVVIDNPNAIANSVESFDLLPDGLKIPVIENSRDELQHAVDERMMELYGENGIVPEPVRRRVEEEMEAIQGRGYDVIYLSARRLVQASNARGYVVGSRGSVGSSLAAYMAGITEVNALPAHYSCPNCKRSDFSFASDYGAGADLPDADCPVCGTAYEKEGFDIPFETFLGVGGDKVPDIDLNFSGEDQSNAHRDAIEMFGSDKVFRAGTIGGLADKTAFGYVRKYAEERGKVLPKAELERLSAMLAGAKKTTGQHPGGLVVIPTDMEVYDFTPIQRPGDEKDVAKRENLITTHIEYHAMESNLLKLDMLGHDDPSIVKMLRDLTGVDPTSLPLADPDVMALFANGKGTEALSTAGVPEFGTGFTRGMLEDTKPTKVSVLVRLSGFSHGTDVWSGNARTLIQDGHGVEEVIGCRDDVMIYLTSMGMESTKAFKIMEAVRKGKGLTDEEASDMQALKVPDWYIESCRKIKYLFPKSHAAAYIMMALRIAWYKVHRPAAYYAAYFTIRAKAFNIDVMSKGESAIRGEMKRLLDSVNGDLRALKGTDESLYLALELALEMWLRGIKMQPVSFHKSDPLKFRVEDNSLVPPFTSVSGLGDIAALDLAAARDARSDWTVAELAAACPKVSSAHIEELKKLNAFDGMSESAQVSLW